MDSLVLSLYQSVKSALDAGHVGVPLFVRCVAHVAPDRVGLTEALRQVAAVAGAWLGAPARRVYVQGSAEAGQITASVQYTRGESALVSVNPVRADGAPRVDLMLLGNTGALYHEGSALSRAQLDAAGTPSGDLPALPESQWRAIEESLRTGRAVNVVLAGDS
jgi:hypothetical protein